MKQGQAAVSKEKIRKTSPRKSRKPDRDAIVEEFSRASGFTPRA